MGVVTSLYVWPEAQDTRLSEEAFSKLLTRLVEERVVTMPCRLGVGVYAKECVYGRYPVAYEGSGLAELLSALHEHYAQGAVGVHFACLDPEGPDICADPDGVECDVLLTSMDDKYVVYQERRPSLETLRDEYDLSEEEIAETLSFELVVAAPAFSALLLEGKNVSDAPKWLERSTLLAVLQEALGPVRWAAKGDH